MSSNPEVPSAEMVLAAIDRAVRQSVRPVTDVSASFIAEHLSLNRRSGAWRQALRLLRELEAVGEVEQGRRLSVTVWALTDAGRERLARVVRHGQGPSLPESPQLRRWRESRRLAAQDADRFRAELVAALEDGLQLLNEAATSSDAWLALSSRLARAADRVGAVMYCLTEWPEPGEGGPDLSEGPRMRSRARFGESL
jgi:DNA-binding PadR family transcriptional regulator